MNDRTGRGQDADEQDVGDLRAALGAHRHAYRHLVYRDPLTHQARTTRPRAPRLAALLAAGLAAVAFALLWPSSETEPPTSLAREAPAASLSLRPDPVRLTGLTKRPRLQTLRHDRITRVRFRPPQRPAQREG